MKYFFSLIALCICFFSCGDNKEVDCLQFNFKLTYDGDPLVMFDEYDYPGGNKIYFSRVSFYMSDVTIFNDDTPSGSEFLIEENDYINLTDSHITLDGAEEGLKVEYELPTTNIDQVFFNIGMDANDNATTPIEYTSDNDLSLAGEYWPGWRSYVFAKIEGMIDLNGDGTLEQPIALHLGSDEARRNLITQMLDNKRELNFNIDIQKVFDHSGEIYDIATTPQIHTIDDVDATDAINYLSTGLINAFELVN